MTKKTKPCCTKTPAQSNRGKLCRGKKTYLQVIANIGWGNALFIRGAEAPLNWDEGIALQNADLNHWYLELNITKPIEFKVLINDEQWSNGENYTLNPGDNLSIEPSFGSK